MNCTANRRRTGMWIAIAVAIATASSVNHPQPLSSLTTLFGGLLR